ncbi:MAG TPA: twin-arginine translocase TatA/TatE family subunit [Planctomycetaceae bacterium]|nr:twin-arginine translocase TatA/TatE family subunit [Blastopirellula sp.]HAY78591.1 twin-arginine translocase TatA/TatE family subunit [Planctomycetaceae bacterium]
MFGLGHFELLILLAVILLLFGSARLPSLMRNLGRSATEFKKGVQGVEEELNEAASSASDIENQE